MQLCKRILQFSLERHSVLVWFGVSPALCRQDFFIKAYVGLSWHDAGFQPALEGTCQEKYVKILD